MSPFLGGEFVIAFLAARIALWIWRSRAALRAPASEPTPPPRGGRTQPALRLVHVAPPAARPSLPRAA